MKKSYWIGVLSISIVVFLLVSVASPVEAKPLKSNGVADGDWTAGSPISINLAGTTFPNWLQLMDNNGSLLSATGQICHPFRGGMYGWTAEIRMLDGSNWVKLPTTMQWMPDEDGAYTACAQAPDPGTYALFGYYDAADVPGLSNAATCQYRDWIMYFWYHDDGYEWDEGYSPEIRLATDPSIFPVDAEVKYTISGDWPLEGFPDLPQTLTTVSWQDGDWVYATFTDFIFSQEEYDSIADDLSVPVVVETGGCTYTITLTKQTYEEAFPEDE